MIITIKTNDKDLSKGHLIAEQYTPGYVQGVWAIIKTHEGHYMTALCANRKSYYEWLSFADEGKTFVGRDDAVAYILAMPGISKEIK
jgi:hypothetical protein